MIDIEKIIDIEPQCLINQQRLKSFLMDLYPENINKKYINIILAIQTAVGRLEISNTSEIDNSKMDTILNQVSEEYGFIQDIVDECITYWKPVWQRGMQLSKLQELVIANKYDKIILNSELSLLISRAEHGDGEAEYRLGLRFLEGDELPQDYSKALYWLRKACENNNENALNEIGNCYYHAIGVEQDVRKAVYYYEKSSNMGCLEATNNLAYCYQHGVGVLSDVKKAAELYLLAANRGNADAQFNTAFCYEKGIGIEKNGSIAIEWLIKSANQGYPNALFNLAKRFAFGDGVPLKPREAFKYAERAARQNFFPAIGMLGQCYYSGFGTTRDKDRAITIWKHGIFLGDIYSQYYFGKHLLETDHTLEEHEYAMNLLHMAFEGADSELMEAISTLIK